MTPFYSAALTTMAHLMKIGLGFIFLKLSAVYLGVQEVGLLGQFASLVALLFLVAGGGIGNGVIKYVAELRFNPRSLLTFILAAKTYAIMFGVSIFIFCTVFSLQISNYVFGDSSFYWVIIFLGFSQIGFAFSSLVIGVANGLADTKTYALIQIFGYSLALPIVWLLIKYFGVLGAALALVMMFLSNSLPSYYFYKNSKFNNKVVGIKIVRDDFKKLSIFSFMALAGAISFPLVELIVRSALISNIGHEAAGLWQASIKISSAYMGFFIVFLSVYFMPLVSAQKNKNDISKLVVRYMTIIALIFLVGAVTFYLMRDYLILLLLSEEFSGLASVVHYQLMGDFFRVLSFVIGFVVIGKAALKIYLVGELAQGITFCWLSLYFLDMNHGLKGVLFAHFLMNIIYFGCSCIAFIFYVRRGRSDYVDS